VSLTSRWWRVAALEEIPEGEGRAVTIGDDEVAVFRCPSGVRAVSSTCPHAGGPLADGIVAGDTVACPLHGRVVDLRSGKVADCEGGVAVYAVRVHDLEIWVETP